MCFCLSFFFLVLDEFMRPVLHLQGLFTAQYRSCHFLHATAGHVISYVHCRSYHFLRALQVISFPTCITGHIISCVQCTSCHFLREVHVISFPSCSACHIMFCVQWRSCHSLRAVLNANADPLDPVTHTKPLHHHPSSPFLTPLSHPFRSD